jgi:hypothetical protein
MHPPQSTLTLKLPMDETQARGCRRRLGVRSIGEDQFPPLEPCFSKYVVSSAVSSTISGRQLPKPGGARSRSTLPPPPETSPWTVGGQQVTYGGFNQASPYSPQPYQHQQPYQPGSFYAQPVQQPYYGQNPPPQQGAHWNNQYPNYGLTTPPPGSHEQPGGWGWPGNGAHYRP